MDLNLRSLVAEVTTLPTVPMPKLYIVLGFLLIGTYKLVGTYLLILPSI